MADVERMAVRVWTWKTWQRAHEEPDHIDCSQETERWQLVPGSLSPFCLVQDSCLWHWLLTSDEAPAMSSNPHIPVQTRPGVCFNGDFTPNLDNRR